MIVYGHRRQRQVERALATDDYAPLEGGVAVALVTFGVALAVATIALLFL